MSKFVDIAIVGTGAAGLMAACWAGRTARIHKKRLRILALDGQKKLGAKILLSGGGRCNVTHDVVDESAYAGSTPPAIRKVLRRFDASCTIQFFRELGVKFKREETGKLFPVTNDAAAVLNALLDAARDVGVEFLFPAKVEHIAHAEQEQPDTLRLTGKFGEILASKVILATGGKSLPKTGSDGNGYELAKRLGHSITPHLLPALVPLTLDESCFIRQLSGLTTIATLELRSDSGKRLLSVTDSTLCTHFGLSGPSVLDISRHYLQAVADGKKPKLIVNWLPDETSESFETALVKQSQRSGSSSIGHFLGERLPQRLVKAMCEQIGVNPSVSTNLLTKPQRKAITSIVTALPLPVTGSRGFSLAEVTAGGIPLKELHLDTMESRVCPGLYLCGEICDVDGRIGGYNFQWAWAGGYLAGSSASTALLSRK